MNTTQSLEQRTRFDVGCEAPVHVQRARLAYLLRRARSWARRTGAAARYGSTTYAAWHYICRASGVLMSTDSLMWQYAYNAANSLPYHYAVLPCPHHGRESARIQGR